MLISIDNLNEWYADKDFSKFTDKRLERKLAAIEAAIRRYTLNTFQNRNKRTTAHVSNHVVHGDFTYFKVGDTVQISASINAGLYVIQSMTDKTIELDAELYDCEDMLVTVVEYPMDIVDGAIELLDWECNVKSLKGVTSETISRHSVSYKDYNGSNTIEGYPSELFGFARKYCQWRT